MSEALLGTIAVKLAAKTAEFNRDVEKSKETLGSISAVAAGVAAKSAISFGVIAGAIATVTKFASEELAAQRKLAGAFAATGESFDMDAFSEFAASIQKVTTTGDDAVMSLGALMGSLGLNQNQIQALIPGMLDLSATTGAAADTIGQKLATAIATGKGELKKMGIVLSETEQEAFEMGTTADRTALLVEKMGRFAGAAAIEAGTAAGRFDQLSTAAGNVLAEIGMIIDAPLAAVLEGVRDAVQDASDAIANMSPEAKQLAAKLVFVALAGAGLTAFIATVIASKSAMVVAVAAIGGAFKVLALKVAPIIALLSTTIGMIRLIGETDGLSAKGIANLKGRLVSEGKMGADAGFGETLGALTMDTMSRGLMMDKIDELFAGAEKATGDMETKATEAAKALGKLEGVAQRVVSPAAAAVTLGDGGNFDFASNVTPDIAAAFGEPVEDNSFDFPLDRFSDLSDSAGESAESMTKVGETASAMGTALDVGIDMLLGSMSQGGEKLSAVMQGAQAGSSGGPWGMVIGAIIGLLSTTESFGRAMELIDESLGTAAGLLDEFMAPITRLLGQILGLVSVFTEMAQGLGFLGAVIGIFDAVLQGVGYIIQGIAFLLAHAWNKILDLAMWVIKIFDVGDDSKVLKDVRNMKLDTDSMQEALEHSWNDAWNTGTAWQAPVSDVGPAAEAAAAGLNDLAGELSNDPQGFKIELRRFQAAAGGMITPHSGASVAGGVTFNVYATDLETAATKLNAIAEFRRWTGGQRVPMRTPFSVPRGGG